MGVALVVGAVVAVAVAVGGGIVFVGDGGGSVGVGVGAMTVKVVLAVSPVVSLLRLMVTVFAWAVAGTIRGNEKGAFPAMKYPIVTSSNCTVRRPGVKPIPLIVTFDPAVPLVGKTATCGSGVGLGVAVEVGDAVGVVVTGTSVAVR